MKYIIIDIDGTIAQKYPERETYDYHLVHLDIPINKIINLISMVIDRGYKPIFITGRKDDCRGATGKWLNQHVSQMVGHSNYPKNLYMRSSDDFRCDTAVKKDLLDRALKDYDITINDIEYAFEDRLIVVKMWHSLGITVIDVSQGLGDF